MKALTEILKIAAIHEMRIQSALQHTRQLFPMDEQTFLKLSEDNLVWVDFLINRFGKLQDLMGTKIIDLFLESQAENIESLTIIDKINKLERLGLIEHADVWKEMRRARNHVAHEYPDTPLLTVNYLNQIYNLSPVLLNILSALRNKLNLVKNDI